MPESNFFQDPLVLGSSVLIRKSYVDILEFMWSHKNYQRFLLLGTPGTGKTTYGFMLAHDSVSRGHKVVYIRDDIIVVLQNSTITRYDSLEPSVLRQVLSPDCVLIVDAMKPPKPVAITPILTILISSPRSDVFNEFKKNAQTLVLPTWSLEELENGRSLCDVALSADKLVRLFDTCGGVPRRIFLSETVNLGGEGIELLISRFSLEKIENTLNLHNMDEVTSRVIHLNPKIDENSNYIYNEITWGFASEHVYQLCMNQWIQKSADHVNKLLTVAFSGGELGVLEGHLFESYVHNFLVYGDVSSCKWKCITDPTRASLQVKASGKIKRFSSQKWTDAFELAGETAENASKDSVKLPYDDSYFRPYNRNFPSFDSAQGHVVYQITANESKRKVCALKDLKSWLSVCRKDSVHEECHIVQVVPGPLLDHYEVGLQIVTDAGNAPQKLPENICFWVLGVPFERNQEELARVLRGKPRKPVVQTQT